MYIIILFFTSLFLTKSILFNHYYTNYLYLFVYPLELSVLSLFNPKNDLTSYIRWILLGWTDLEYKDNDINFKETNLLNKIQDNENPYSMIICWILTVFFYQIYYIINEKYVNNNNINKWSFYSYNLKFCMINYLSLYLWNLNILMNSSKNGFWMVLINLFIFNAITFWFTGYLFNFIYGEKLYMYRVKFSFLIENINPAYKYFSIIMIGMKALTGLYILFFNLLYDFRFIPLFLCLFMYITVFLKNKFFINNTYNTNKYIVWLCFVALLIILLSTISNFYINEIEFIIIQSILIVSYIILMIFFIQNIDKNTIEYNDGIELIELSSLTEVDNL